VTGRREVGSIMSHNAPAPTVCADPIEREARSSKWPSVTVIVPCYNSAQRVRALLDALGRQTYAREHYRVVLVDDGSTDDAFAAISGDLRVTLLRQNNGGSYKARNTGIRESSGEIVVFTDDDCRPEPDWLERGVQALLDRSADLVGGRVNVEMSDAASLLQLFDVNFYLKQEWYIRQMQWAVTANLFVRRSVLEALNGFNEAVRSGGDRAFGRAAARAGHKLVYAPDAIVNHPARKTLTELIKKVRRIAGATELYNIWQICPRTLGTFPPGFHDADVLALRGLRKWRFQLLFYFLEGIRVLSFTISLGARVCTGRRNTPFRGLRQR
jgi:GT2 family glycosyltransferase